MTLEEDIKDSLVRVGEELKTLRRDLAQLKHAVCYWYIEAKGYRPAVEDEEILKAAITEAEDDLQ